MTCGFRDLTDEFHSASLQANLGDLATDFIGLVRSQLVSNTVSIHTVEGGVYNIQLRDLSRKFYKNVGEKCTKILQTPKTSKMRYLLVCKYPNSPPQAKIFGDLSIGVKGVYPPLGWGGVRWNKGFKPRFQEILGI